MKYYYFMLVLSLCNFLIPGSGVWGLLPLIAAFGIFMDHLRMERERAYIRAQPPVILAFLRS